MSMNSSIMLTLTFFFLFINFLADTVSSASAESAFEGSMGNERKFFYSGKALQSGAAVAADISSESETEVSYSDYCSSIVPESVTKSNAFTKSFGPFDEYQTGYYSGGNRILNTELSRISSSLSFETRYASNTVADGVSKIMGSLTFYRSYDSRMQFYLMLHGFWSEHSGNLCMVGRGFASSKEANLLSPTAVFKLSKLKSSSTITTLITGTLESLSSSDRVDYFEPISVIMFPKLNYEYTFDSRESVDESSAENDTKHNLPFNVLPSRSFCSIISGSADVFKFQYSSVCGYGKKNCVPFGGMIGYLPRFLSFSIIRCSEIQKKIQVLVEFRNKSYVRNYQSFNPNATLVGEGIWDEKKNRLFVYACQFLDINESWSNAHVGDCTTRLSFWFPATLSIRETSSAMGQIWTTKTVNDSGYFDKILFGSTDNHLKRVPGLKYEYTEFYRVENLCLTNEQVRNKCERYPSAHSIDMKFDLEVENSEKKYGWGLAVPLAIGDLLYEQYLYPMALPSPTPASWIQTGPINVSYVLSIWFQSPAHLIDGVYFSYLFEEKVEITAEGVYDSETGKLCMVGCRKLGSSNQVFRNASVDCEILLNFQLSPVEPNKSGGGYIKGSIKSTRKKSDPLYFDRLNVLSAGYTPVDLEITKVLISNTLVCIFVGLQLYHVKKKPEVLSCVSLIMLLILTLGYMIPLALDFEALCSNKQDQDKFLPLSGGWFELNEVIVMVFMVVPFLLLLRLLQLTITARSLDANQKCLWFAEKMTLLIIGCLYAAGAKITLLIAWEKRRPEVMFPPSSVQYQLYPVCNDLKSYAGLLLDCFLLPQIFFNMVSNSKQNALSCSFYIGTTFVRLLPRSFDPYCSHSYFFYNIFRFNVNHDKSFSSAAWDVIMLFALLLLAAIIYFQQKFGGQCILPSRFREFKTYPEEGSTLTESSKPEELISA